MWWPRQLAVGVFQNYMWPTPGNANVILCGPELDVGVVQNYICPTPGNANVILCGGPYSWLWVCSKITSEATNCNFMWWSKELAGNANVSFCGGQIAEWQT